MACRGAPLLLIAWIQAGTCMHMMQPMHGPHAHVLHYGGGSYARTYKLLRELHLVHGGCTCLQPYCGPDDLQLRVHAFALTRPGVSGSAQTLCLCAPMDVQSCCCKITAGQLHAFACIAHHTLASPRTGGDHHALRLLACSLRRRSPRGCCNTLGSWIKRMAVS